MSAFAIACWTWMRLAFVLSPEPLPSALMFCCWSRAHEEISSLHLKRPIVSRSALSSTGRNSVSRNAPKPSSPSQGCRRVPPAGMGYVRLPKRASNSFISLSSPVPVKAVVKLIFASSPTSTPSSVGTRTLSTPTRSPPLGALVMM